MYINKGNRNTWTVEPGLSNITIPKNCFGATDLPVFLQKMGKKLAILPNKHLDLIFWEPLTDEQLLQLAKYIHTQADVFPFCRINLPIAETSLQSEGFKQLTQALNSCNIQELKLQIIAPHTLDNIATALEPCAEYIHYPVTLDGIHSDRIAACKLKILENVRNHNYAKLDADLNGTIITMPAVHEPATIETIADDLQAKIKLKQLINPKNQQSKAFDAIIKLETDVVDLEQQQLQQTTEIQQQISTEETQQLAAHTGDKYDYEYLVTTYPSSLAEEQRAEYFDKIALIKSELFGNLPQAIKFLTPAAFNAILRDSDELGSLNKDNLPQNFTLKQTAAGELVLDHDLLTPDKKLNAYTPNPNNKYRRFKYLERFDADDENRKFWIANEFKTSSKYMVAPLLRLDRDKHINIWFKFGDKCLEVLNKALYNCETQHPGSVDFLLQNYVKHLQDWDCLLENGDFIRCLNAISSFDKTKIACLQKFLLKTGSSQHDLQHSLSAFEEFWADWLKMAAKNKLEPTAILSNWTTPTGGDPVVYMERLLTILTKARNLKEQCECLDGIELTNYGAYYASKYEDFKLVSKEMQFNYANSIEQCKVAFTPSMNLYRVNNAEQLEVETYTENIDMAIVPSCRLIGQQPESIELKTFAKTVKEFVKNKPFLQPFATSICALFVAHSRYSDQTKLHDLLHAFYTLDVNFDISLLAKLAKLYFAGIYLSPAEGKAIAKGARWEPTIPDTLFNSYKPSPRNFIHRYFSRTDNMKSFELILDQLYTNKIGTLKFFKYIATDHDFPFLFDSNGANYTNNENCIFKAKLLETELPEFAAEYKTDLLLFCAMLIFDPQNFGISSRFCWRPIGDNDGFAQLDRIKPFLAKAAQNPKPNNFATVLQYLLAAKNPFGYKMLIDAFEEIDKLENEDKAAVEKILLKHKFNLAGGPPDVFSAEGETIKSVLIMLILLLRKNMQLGQRATPELLETSGYDEEQVKQLSQMDLAALRNELEKNWPTAGSAGMALGTPIINSLLNRLKNHTLNEEFKKLGESKLGALLRKKLYNLPAFDLDGDFEKLAYVNGQASQLANLLETILAREECSVNEQQYLTLFNSLDYSKLDADTLIKVFAQLNNMPQREYLGILQVLFKQPLENQAKLVDLIHELDNKGLPTEYIIKFIQISGEVGITAVNEFMQDLLQRYNSDNDDPLLRWMLSANNLKFMSLKKIAALTKNCHKYRSQIQQLIKAQTNIDNFVAGFTNPETTPQILEMLARSFMAEPEINRENIDCKVLLASLNKLSTENIALLYEYYQQNTPGAACLQDRLNNYTGGDFKVFLNELEKAPFGERNSKVEFDSSQVERVVNAFVDKSNKDRAYTYSYRKQLLEAFLFVNAAGNDLKIYNNQAAKDLTNKQIQDILAEIKISQKPDCNNRFTNMSRMQRSLYALALMREAMYRSTGQFPYSTQILGLIDCILHEGDVISNIDTGQGKSLIDTMKAAILWLDSDRVDVSTSSIVDAKRDVEIYTPFLKLCGIKHATKPITSDLDIKDYAVDGINYSTLAQLALFTAKVKGNGAALGKPKDRVSLVLNESDFSILDDKTIYRYASCIGADLGRENEWIYTALNQFVQLAAFVANNTSAETDLARLKQYLLDEALRLKKPTKILETFTDKQLLTWIDSAILVNYRLREDFDYVVTKQKEERVIRKGEQPRPTRLVKVLMQDKKVSPDTKFGNGVQQLICAKLNTELKRNDFELDPESKTIISLNNRNMIDYYRSKLGIIWGSSGTVGNPEEIELQLANYGFEFSKLEAHQQKRVQKTPARICANEQQQFRRIIRELRKDIGKHNAAPAVVFFKDIKTAERFYAELQNINHGRSMQLFTGLGDEEHIIQQAAQPGMVTITTAALGRNTDIKYNKSIGMKVYQTFVDTFRKEEQRAGRTGRQGSKGTVHEIYNQADFPGLSKAEAQQVVEQHARDEREANERFYNILYCFSSSVDKLPPEIQTKDFYTKKWAMFSADLEEQFRLATPYFIKYAVDQFNQLIDSCKTTNTDLNTGLDGLKLTPENIVENLKLRHAAEQKPEPFAQAINISESRPAHITAYDYLTAAGGTTPITEAEVKARVSEILSSHNSKQFIAKNYDYIKYLNSGSQLSNIRTWHQQAISDFLNSNTTDNSNRKTKKRWLGVAGHLNSIVSNENYLLLFKALSDVPGDALQAHEICSVLKKSICSLIEEYLQYSWFISPYKRSQMTELKKAIANAGNVEDVITHLAKVKSTVIDEDIRLNNLPMYKRPKAVNLSGQSRFQTTLDNALALTAAVSGQDVQQEYLNELNTKLGTSIKHSTAPVAAENLDAFKLQQSLFHYRDRQKNAAVIGRSIEKVLQRKSVVVHGMKGRKSP